MKKMILAMLLLLIFSISAFAAVNINSAGSKELQGLSGIGKVESQAIIDFRKEHGPFKSVDDLTQVKGIGRKTVEKLKDQIVVEKEE